MGQGGTECGNVDIPTEKLQSRGAFGFHGCAPAAWELGVFILYVRMEEVGLLYTAE